MKTLVRVMLILISAFLAAPSTQDGYTLVAQQIQISPSQKDQKTTTSSIDRSIIAPKTYQALTNAQPQNPTHSRSTSELTNTFDFQSDSYFRIPASDSLVSVIVEFFETPSVLTSLEKSTSLPGIATYQQPVYQLISDLE